MDLKDKRVLVVGMGATLTGLVVLSQASVKPLFEAARSAPKG